MLQLEVAIVFVPALDELSSYFQFTTVVPPSTHTTPWPHFIIDVGLVQKGYSIPSPVLLKCCVASVVA